MVLTKDFITGLLEDSIQFVPVSVPGECAAGIFFPGPVIKRYQKYDIGIIQLYT